MKRWIAWLLTAALLFASVVSVAAASQPETVLPEGNDFSFNNGSGWGNVGHWTSGRSEQDGIWAQSDSADRSASAAYVGGKLTGQWEINVQLSPLSTENSGRAVSRVQILDKYKNPKLIFTYEYLTASQQTALSWQAISSADGGDWNDILRTDWMDLDDTALNVRLVRTGETEITMTLSGDHGYTESVTATVAQDVMDVLCYAGLASERSTVRFGNVRLTLPLGETDYAAAADKAYADLMKNFLDPTQNRLYPVTFGMVDGTVTNTGVTVNVYRGGSLWESAVALMAMDTYAQYHDESSEVYRETAKRIANTINFFLDSYTREELTAAGVGPQNWCMDDCGWGVMAFLLGYRYNLFLGQNARAASCLQCAQELYRNSYSYFYDSTLGGGLWYDSAHTTKSLYAATLALAGDELYQITNDESIREIEMSIYYGVENNLRRSDGLYSMSISSDGLEGKDNPYDISEGGSCSYIGGNMCMAVLNARFGETEKAKITSEGIALFETTRSGALLNDRDAWNNTFFLGFFLREVVETGIADVRYGDILRLTASNILTYAVFDEGYYSAAWEGPKEPDVKGYPTSYPMEDRNRWGTQNNQNGVYVGSSPHQLMTTATTIHVLFAAAALSEQPAAAELTSLSVEGASLWPVFNPDITSYRLTAEQKDAVTLAWTADDGIAVTLNGEAATSPATTAADCVQLTTTAADGSSRTYTIEIREACKHEHTDTQTVAATCTEAGSITVVCTDCGATLSVQTLDPTGHHFVDGVCTVCGAEDPNAPVPTVEPTEPSAKPTESTEPTEPSAKPTESTEPTEPSAKPTESTEPTQPSAKPTESTEPTEPTEKPTEPTEPSKPWSNPFTDVKKTEWYYDGVAFACAKGLMNGMGNNKFEPDTVMTRAMLVTVLWRNAGSPKEGKNTFTDVKNGQWYTDAIAWAAKNGIVNGMGNNTFEPDTEITREQIATILYRYAGGKAPQTDRLSAFRDAADVSAYARDAMGWAVEAGLINGIDGRLAPTEGATRAQIATILMRFLAE